MNLIDLKANIIPQVDPGCSSLSGSINKLKLMKESNISKICAAPEYYDSINFNINDMLVEIQKESSKLEGFKIPELTSGVVYPLNLDFKKINNFESINKTAYIFCRFPSHDLNKNFSENINSLLTRNYIPILVNIENSNVKINQIKELKEIGCLVSVDLYLSYWSNTAKDCIRKLESDHLIDIVAGFSKFENLKHSAIKFSEDSKINMEKLENLYMNENPNLILESPKK